MPDHALKLPEGETVTMFETDYRAAYTNLLAIIMEHGDQEIRKAAAEMHRTMTAMQLVITSNGEMGARP